MGALPVRRRTLLLAGVGTLAGSAMSGCTNQSTPQLDRLVLATGPDGAVYREIGAALVKELQLALPNTEVVARQSSASVDNIRLLNANEAQLGLCSLDAALPSESTPPVGEVSAVCRLYDSFLHLVVPQSSLVSSAADLVRLRLKISAGAKDSGTDFTVRRLSAVTGLQFSQFQLGQAASANALEHGEIDAFFTLTGIPTPAITQLVRRLPVRMVQLKLESEQLVAKHKGPYVPATIPRGTYGDIAPCETLSVPNLLLARNDLPANVVEIVTQTVFDKASAIAADHPEARRINPRTGISTASVPLHPGAASYFRKAKRGDLA